MLPEARLVPPVGKLNQFTVPVLDTPPNTTEPVPQREPGVVEVIVGDVFTVIETELVFEHPVTGLVAVNV